MVADNPDNHALYIRNRRSVCVFFAVMRIALKNDALRRRVLGDIPHTARRNGFGVAIDAEKIFYAVNAARLFCRAE